MKIRDSLLLVLGTGLLVTSGSLVVFAVSQVANIAGVTSEASSEVLVSDANQGLESIAIGIRDSLDSQMQNQYQMVRTWARVPSLVEAAKAAQQKSPEELFDVWSSKSGRTFGDQGAKGDGDPSDDLVPAASLFLAALVKETPYPELFATDSRGFVVAAGAATSDFDQGPDDYAFFADRGLVKYKPEPGGEGWYRAANAAKNGQFVGNVKWDASSKAWGIEIVSQIRDPGDNAYLGTLKAVFNYGQSVDRFVHTGALDVFEIKVVDQKGTVVATSLPDKRKVNNKDVNLSKTPFSLAVLAGKKSGYDSRAESDENGNQVYAGYAVSSDVNHHIVVVTKAKAEVERPIDAFVGSLRDRITAAGQSMQRQMVLVGCGVGALVFLLAFLILKSKITIPLRKLTAVSERLARADIEGLEVDVSGNDEIGHFGESFRGVLAAFHLLMEEADKNRK